MTIDSLVFLVNAGLSLTCLPYRHEHDWHMIGRAILHYCIVHA